MNKVNKASLALAAGALLGLSACGGGRAAQTEQSGTTATSGSESGQASCGSNGGQASCGAAGGATESSEAAPAESAPAQ